MRAHGRFTTMGMGARNRGNASKVNGSAGAKGSRQQPERVAVGVERKRWRGEKPPRRAACASSGGRAACDGRRQRRHLRRARGNTKCRQRRSRAAGLSLARTGKPGKGLPLDYVAAYTWYSRALAAGDASGAGRRKQLSHLMTRKQLDEAASLLATFSSQPQRQPSPAADGTLSRSEERR